MPRTLQEKLRIVLEGLKSGSIQILHSHESVSAARFFAPDSPRDCRRQCAARFSLLTVTCPILRALGAN